MPKLVRQNSNQISCFNFYESTKRRLIAQFTQIKQKHQLNSIVLVLDIDSAKFISKLMTMSQLVDYGIVFVERLQLVRKKLDHHAIYFITPCEKSIQSMLKDYEDKDGQYRKVHVLFTDALDHRLMKKVAQSKYFLKKLVRNSFKEFYCQVNILSDNCVQLDLPFLAPAYSKDNIRQKEMRQTIAKRFVHLIAGYDKLFTVRFYHPKNIANKIAERVVEQCSKQVQTYLNKLLQANSPAVDHTTEDLTVLIVDRSIDVITPIIHGYSYEALLYDEVLPEEKSIQQAQKLPRKIFNQYRYRHISHALSELPKRLNKITEEVKQSHKDPLQLKAKIELQEDLGAHVTLIMNLWQKYQEKQLRQIGQVQLSLATGVTDEGLQTSSSVLINKVSQLIANDQHLTRTQKIRLALLALACVKLSKEDYQKMLGLFHEDQKLILKNFLAFGITYDKNISRSTKNIESSSMERARMLLEQRSIPSERFCSALEITLPQFIKMMENKSSKDINKQNERKATSQSLASTVVSISNQKNPPIRFSSNKVILYMCGGLSQNEVCSIRRDTSMDSILLAADQILSPREFVMGLKEVNILGK